MPIISVAVQYTKERTRSPVVKKNFMSYICVVSECELHVTLDWAQTDGAQ